MVQQLQQHLKEREFSILKLWLFFLFFLYKSATEIPKKNKRLQWRWVRKGERLRVHVILPLQGRLLKALCSPGEAAELELWVWRRSFPSVSHQAFHSPSTVRLPLHQACQHFISISSVTSWRDCTEFQTKFDFVWEMFYVFLSESFLVHFSE